MDPINCLIQEIIEAPIKAHDAIDSIRVITPIVKHWVKRDDWLKPKHRVCDQIEDAHVLYESNDLMDVAVP